MYVSVPPNMQVTYMMQWNLSYQRQIANNWVMKANYMGNAGRHIWGSTDVNQAVGTIAGASTSNTNNRRPTYLAQSHHGAVLTPRSSRPTTAPTPSTMA